MCLCAEATCASTSSYSHPSLQWHRHNTTLFVCGCNAHAHAHRHNWLYQKKKKKKKEVGGASVFQMEANTEVAKNKIKSAFYHLASRDCQSWLQLKMTGCQQVTMFMVVYKKFSENDQNAVAEAKCSNLCSPPLAPSTHSNMEPSAF